MDETLTTWLPLSFTVVALLFWAYCLFDFAGTDEPEIRTFTKPVWILILIFGSVFGGLLWVSVGRPQDKH